MLAPASFSHITSDELEPLFPINIQDHNTLINGSVMPSQSLADLIRNLHENEALMLDGELIAAQLPRAQFARLIEHNDLDDLTGYELDPKDVTLVRNLWQITDIARHQVALDMELLQCGDDGNRPNLMKRGEHPLYIHPSATIEHAYFNTQEGPIYIGPEALIMDGACIRGPAAINSKSVIKLGAALYPGTVIGHHCVVGGEVKNSVMLDHSNKSHAGYLGDSVIGSWCNLGALTSVSNLKNTLSNVQVWHMPTQTKIDSGRLKCGIFMADFCRTGIHTRINAGTVIGVSCHLYGGEIFGGNLPAFTWGLSEEYELSKAIQTIQRVQSNQGFILDQSYVELLTRIFSSNKERRSVKA